MTQEQDASRIRYLPLARKYRPQTFEDLVGQTHVSTTLSQALKSGRMAQAYLFTGQRGVGKTSAARILAKALNCAQGSTATPCNRCASCTQITQGTSLDVVEIDGASNRGIDEIRHLREMVPFAPTQGSYRVYIIDEVHMLTTEAFNALLKTLEEPPAHVKFIFATTAASKVPATILSRCQRFDFRRIDTATAVAALQRLAKAERLPIEESALYAIARASEGSLRDAEVILDQAASFSGGAVKESDVIELLGAVESEALFAWTEAMLDRRVDDALRILSEQMDRGRDAPQLLGGLLRQLRNLLVASSVRQAPAAEELLARLIDEPAERLKRLQEQTNRSTTQELLLLLQLVSSAYELVRRSPMAQTILELVVVKLSTRDRWQSLEQIVRRLERLGDGEDGDPSAASARSGRPAAASAVGPTVSSPSGLARGAATPTTAALGRGAAATDSDSAGAQAEPTGQTDDPASASPEHLMALWPALLERLGAQKMSLAAYLAHARPVGREGGTVTVGLPGFALHHEVLNDAENKRLIDRLLSEVCGEPVAVRYSTLPEPVDRSPAQASEAQEPVPPMVQDIVNLFNATILDRPQPI